MALTSAHPQAGVTHITNALTSALDQSGDPFMMVLNGQYMSNSGPSDDSSNTSCSAYFFFGSSTYCCLVPDEDPPAPRLALVDVSHHLAEGQDAVVRRQVIGCHGLALTDRAVMGVVEDKVRPRARRWPTSHELGSFHSCTRTRSAPSSALPRSARGHRSRW